MAKKGSEFSDEFRKNITQDIYFSKQIKEAGGIDKIEATFKDHNSEKKATCRCDVCVLYRKLYSQS